MKLRSCYQAVLLYLPWVVFSVFFLGEAEQCWAFTDISFPFSASANDISIVYLQKIFGTVSDALTGPNQVVPEIFYLLNTAIMAIGSFFIIWVISRMGWITMQEGSLLAETKKVSTMILIRTLFGGILLFPSSNGYSMMQSGIMYVVIQGVGLADQLWHEVVQFSQQQNPYSYHTVSTATGNSAYIDDVAYLSFGINTPPGTCAADSISNFSYREQVNEDASALEIYRAATCLQALYSSDQAHYQSYLRQGLMPPQPQREEYTLYQGNDCGGSDQFCFGSPQKKTACGVYSYKTADNKTYTYEVVDSLFRGLQPQVNYLYGTLAQCMDSQSEEDCRAECFDAGTECHLALTSVATTIASLSSTAYGFLQPQLCTSSTEKKANPFAINDTEDALGWAMAGGNTKRIIMSHSAVCVDSQDVFNVGSGYCTALSANSGVCSTYAASNYRYQLEQMEKKDLTASERVMLDSQVINSMALTAYSDKICSLATSAAADVDMESTSPAMQSVLASDYGRIIAVLLSVSLYDAGEFKALSMDKTVKHHAEKSAYYIENYLKAMFSQIVGFQLFSKDLNTPNFYNFTASDFGQLSKTNRCGKDIISYCNICSVSKVTKNCTPNLDKTYQCYNHAVKSGCIIYGRGMLGGLAAQLANVRIDPILQASAAGQAMINISTAYLFKLIKWTNSQIIKYMEEFIDILVGVNLFIGLISHIFAIGFGLGGATAGGASMASGLMNMLISTMFELIKLGISAYVPMALAMISVGLYCGFMLGVYVPYYPFVIFLAGVIGWFILVIEAMVAGPVMALGLVHPEGENVLGRSESAIMLLLNLFLRPALMVVSLVIAASISYVAISLINWAFLHVMSEYIYTIDKLISSALFANDWQHFQSYTATVKGATKAFSLLGVFIFYPLLLCYIVEASYSLVYRVPDRVSLWIGGYEDTEEMMMFARRLRSRVGGQFRQFVGGASQAEVSMGTQSQITPNMAAVPQADKKPKSGASKVEGGPPAANGSPPSTNGNSD